MLSQINTSTCTLPDSAVILKINQTDIKPLMVIYSQLFLVSLKLSAYSVTLLGIITSIAISKPGDKLNPRTVLYCIIMMFAALMLFEVRAASFNYGSYKLFHSLLYLPYSSDDYLAEEFGENSVLMQIFVPVLPAVVASMLGFLIVIKKRSQGVDDALIELVSMVREKALSTVALILALIFIVRSLGMPIFFSITQAGLLNKDSLLTWILINYLGIVFPILLTSAVNPVVMIVFTKETHLALLEDIADDLGLDDVVEDMGDGFKNVMNKVNDMNIDMGDEGGDTKRKFKAGFSCFRGKEKVKDTVAIDALVNLAEAKANERRNEVYNTLEKRIRERKELIKSVRKEMNIGEPRPKEKGKEKVKREHEDSPIFGVVEARKKKKKEKFPDENKDLNTLKKNIMEMDERESQKQPKREKRMEGDGEEGGKKRRSSKAVIGEEEVDHDYDVVKEYRPKKKKEKEPNGEAGGKKEKKEKEPNGEGGGKKRRSKDEKDRPSDLAIK